LNFAAFSPFATLLVYSMSDAFAQTATRPAQGGLFEADSPSDSLIGIQYEQWLYDPELWKTAEAIPLLDKYTTHEATVSKHYAQFQNLGTHWLLIDWSNMLWSKPLWEEHTGETQRLEEKTAVLFNTAIDLHHQEKDSPKLVFMLGLQNGPPVPNGVQRLNGILSWFGRYPCSARVPAQTKARSDRAL
jgi:hypothetical protein